LPEAISRGLGLGRIAGLARLALFLHFVSVLALGVPNLSFLPPKLEGPGQLSLSVRGEPNTKYVIERSTDLAVWKPLFTGISSAQGQLDYTFTRPTNSHSAYYLARSRTDLEKLILIPQPDTNYITVALVTTNGGSCALTNQAGVIYTFTVPPLAVTESVAISMTLLTNIGGFPLTNGFRDRSQVRAGRAAILRSSPFGNSLPHEHSDGGGGELRLCRGWKRHLPDPGPGFVERRDDTSHAFQLSRFRLGKGAGLGDL
jgi:hypothetical protein